MQQLSAPQLRHDPMSSEDEEPKPGAESADHFTDLKANIRIGHDSGGPVLRFPALVNSIPCRFLILRIGQSGDLRTQFSAYYGTNVLDGLAVLQ